MKYYPRATIIILFVFLQALAGCTYNPFSDDNHLTGNATGAALGAGAGAITAKILNAPKPLIWLAGIGGAGLGYYVTTLRFTAGGVIQSGGEVYTLGDYVTINIPSNALFEDNSSELLPAATPILISAAEVLDRYPENNIIISGNTSGFGSAIYERQLSEDRAREIATFLWAQGINSFSKDGMSTRKLIYTGYGNYFPVANDITMKGFGANSRIQITSFPKRANLQLDKHHKLFSNIGRPNKCLTCKVPETPVDFNAIFPPNGLPPAG